MDASADALVIGGGPAGLSAALYLARYNRSVLLFDTAQGRSTHAQVNHNYLGFPAGVSARQLRELGGRQVSRYPQVRQLDFGVETLTAELGVGFTAGGQGHVWRGRTVILATGVRDTFPEFAGWEPCVGRSLFWCVTCDGYENRGRNVLVVGHTDAAAGEALQLNALTDRIRLLTGSPRDEIGDDWRKRLLRAGIPVVHDTIERVSCARGMISMVYTRGGHELEADAVFSVQGARPRNDLARQVGAALTADGWVVVDPEQKTTVPGVYAAGDLTALHSHQITTAVHEGAQAASAANYFLFEADG